MQYSIIKMESESIVATENDVGKERAMKIFTIAILLAALLALICLPEFTATGGAKGSVLKIATLY
jgi:hypothetical protein